MAFVGLALPAVAHGDADAELRLAERFAPVLAFKSQSQPCGKGEAYRPAPVELVLGNPDAARGASVAITEVWDTNAGRRWDQRARQAR